MGEAQYYLKAEGCDTPEKLDSINAFIAEGQKAEDWWQNHRLCEGTKPESPLKDRGEFWVQFKARFPTVYEMLEGIHLAEGDCNNALAGKIDFGAEDERARGADGTLYFDALVWHFADWNVLANFLEKKFELTEVRWLSDEYTDIYDLL